MNPNSGETNLLKSTHRVKKARSDRSQATSMPYGAALPWASQNKRRETEEKSVVRVAARIAGPGQAYGESQPRRSGELEAAGQSLADRHDGSAGDPGRGGPGRPD